MAKKSIKKKATKKPKKEKPRIAKDPLVISKEHCKAIDGNKLTLTFKKLKNDIFLPEPDTRSYSMIPEWLYLVNKMYHFKESQDMDSEGNFDCIYVGQEMKEIQNG